MHLAGAALSPRTKVQQVPSAQVVPPLLWAQLPTHQGLGMELGPSLHLAPRTA